MSKNENFIAPSVRYVRSLEGKYYLLREAAEMLGVSHRTLRKMNQEGDPEKQPSFYTYLGKIQIYLYTDDDIERIRKIIEDSRAVYPSSFPAVEFHIKGRPPKWSTEQRKDRQRKFSKVHYYKTMAEKHAQAGHQEKANEAIRKMRIVQKELKDEEQLAIRHSEEGQRKDPPREIRREEERSSTDEQRRPLPEGVSEGRDDSPVPGGA